MHCPEPSRLRELLDGVLPPAQQQELSNHLDTCANCQDIVERLVPRPEHLAHLAQAAAVPETALQRVLLELQATSPLAAPTEPDPTATLDFLQPPQAPDQLGRLGPYAILSVIGRGGMGIVFKALDPLLQRHVAIKVMAPQLAASLNSRKRFLREAQAAAAIGHENVIDIYSVAEADGLPYLVMEYVAGGSLQARLNQSEPVNFREALRLGIQTARGLTAAHDQGLVHRDIKPANILIADAKPPAQPAAKITDFGLARVADDPSLSQSGLIAGTPRYMPPEQARGEAADHRADIYSLGVTLYETLTGKPAFGGDLRDVLRQVANDEPPAPRRLNPSLPWDVETVVLKAMAKEVRERYGTAQELGDDLERCLNDEPIKARRPALARRLQRLARRHRPLLWTTGLALAAVLVLAVIGLTVNNRLIRAEKERTDIERVRADDNLAHARKVVENFLTSVAESPNLKGANFQALRKQLLETALPFYEEFARQQGDDPALQAERGRAYDRLAFVWTEMGDREKALENLKAMGAIFERLTAADPTDPAYRRDLATSHHRRGVLQMDRSNWVEAEARLRRGMALREELANQDPTNSDYQYYLAGSLQSLNNLLCNPLAPVQRLDEAERCLRQALAIQERLGDEARIRQARGNILVNLGALLAMARRPAEAESAYRAAAKLQELLIDDLPGTTAYRFDLARTCNNLGNLVRGSRRIEAEALYRRAIALLEKLVADFPLVPDYLHVLARTCNGLGVLLETDPSRRVDCEAAHRQSLAAYRRLAAESPTVTIYVRELGMGHTNLGGLLRLAGRWKEAEAIYREGLLIQEALTAKYPAAALHSVDVGVTYASLGAVAQQNGDAATALTWFDKALPRLEAEPEPRRTQTRLYLCFAYGNRADALLSLRRHTEALSNWSRAIELSPGGDHSWLRQGRARALALTGDHVQAVTEALLLSQDKTVTGQGLHNLAAICALAAARAQPSSLAEQYGLSAVELLRKSQATGFFNDPGKLNALKEDTDFGAVRARPDFQSLFP